MTDARSVTELAAEYVSGTLDDETSRSFENHLLDGKVAQQAVALWETRVESFLGAIATATLRENDKPWIEIAPDITGKALHYDHLVGSMIYIVRLEPGARCPTAESGSPEECLLISGDLTLGEITLKAGDHHHASNSVIHGGGHSDGGAVLFIRAGDV